MKHLLALIALPILAVALLGQDRPNNVPNETYSVAGGVNRPGLYPLTKPTTVFEAINGAGGFVDALSDRSKITIIRSSSQRFYFNYAEYIQGKSREGNILVQVGDTIIIGQAQQQPAHQ